MTILIRAKSRKELRDKGEIEMTNKRYDKEYKVQAVKLIKEIGMTKASKELGVSSSTMRGWVAAAKQGQLDLGEGGYTPQGAMSLAEEIAVLRKQNKELTKTNKRLQEENEFLAEASAFFAASRRKSAKTRD